MQKHDVENSETFRADGPHPICEPLSVSLYGASQVADDKADNTFLARGIAERRTVPSPFPKSWLARSRSPGASLFAQRGDLNEVDSSALPSSLRGTYVNPYTP